MNTTSQESADMVLTMMGSQPTGRGNRNLLGICGSWAPFCTHITNYLGYCGEFELVPILPTLGAVLLGGLWPFSSLDGVGASVVATRKLVGPPGGPDASAAML